MDLASIVSWITANWPELIQAILAVVGAASVIVKLTPTPRDDAFLQPIISLLGQIALNPKTPTPPTNLSDY